MITQLQLINIIIIIKKQKSCDLSTVLEFTQSYLQMRQDDLTDISLVGHVQRLAARHNGGPAVAQSVEALRYKSEGRGFDSRWRHWNFPLT